MFIAVKICLEDPQSQIIDAQNNTCVSVYVFLHFLVITPLCSQD